MQKILIIDDQLDADGLPVTMLQLDGYDAEWLVGNWNGLLSEIEERSPDLVIPDMRRPDVNGLELVCQLRAHSDPIAARIPVLLASALDHRYDGKCAGASGFLSKPCTRQTLLETIEHIDSGGISTKPVE